MRWAGEDVRMSGEQIEHLASEFLRGGEPDIHHDQRVCLGSHNASRQRAAVAQADNDLSSRSDAAQS